MLKDMELQYPSNILYLIFAIAAIIFFILAFGKKQKILARLHLEFKMRFKVLRSIFLAIGLGLMVFSLLGPQSFTGYTEVEKTGLDIYVIMDTSKSMLVTDIQPDRISIAKKIIKSLLSHLDGDRIGFIPFASSAYIQMPLTDDYQLALMFLEVIDTDMISGGGTNLSAAIQLAYDSFTRTSSSDKVIIILSDGEEHESSGVEALKGITDDSLRIYTIGVGTEKGGLVPIYNDAGNSVISYIQDESGNYVTSRLNSDTLVKLSQEGRGSYYQASVQGTETYSLLEELSALKRSTLAAEKVRMFKPLYQYFLGVGILMILLSWFLPERRRSV